MGRQEYLLILVKIHVVEIVEWTPLLRVLTCYTTRLTQLASSRDLNLDVTMFEEVK